MRLYPRDGKFDLPYIEYDENNLIRIDTSSNQHIGIIEKQHINR